MSSSCAFYPWLIGLYVRHGFFRHPRRLDSAGDFPKHFSATLVRCEHTPESFSGISTLTIVNLSKDAWLTPQATKGAARM